VPAFSCRRAILELHKIIQLTVTWAVPVATLWQAIKKNITISSNDLEIENEARYFGCARFKTSRVDVRRRLWVVLEDGTDRCKRSGKL